ncbi:MAG: phosphoribosylanthranilate isomerase [Candidatus Methanoperedens sp.]|nr:phosphoribosylanthranilate isomerase [Candidatus Methanoperedens sp.]MCZ7370403.1 phosphoribosylanthranilate isomerase [Candidatus Methanoperedens sp.]
MRVKICGIKTERDLAIAVNAGADAVGFITEVPVDSPRKISLADASRLISKVPLFITPVLVIMPENAEQAVSMVHAAKPGAVQIHNALPLPELKKIRETGVKLIKTIPVSLDADPKLLMDLVAELKGTADAVLLDTMQDGRSGGTGLPHDWKISSEVILRAGIPVILAGGLNPQNVKAAVRNARPYAVDTASGVETDGRKDEKKVVDFISNARMA